MQLNIFFLVFSQEFKKSTVEMPLKRIVFLFYLIALQSSGEK